MLNLGPRGSLLAPCAGYLHTLPRIVAAVTERLVPVQFFALSVIDGTCGGKSDGVDRLVFPRLWSPGPLFTQAPLTSPKRSLQLSAVNSDPYGSATTRPGANRITGEARSPARRSEHSPLS